MNEDILEILHKFGGDKGPKVWSLAASATLEYLVLSTIEMWKGASKTVWEAVIWGS